MLHLHHLFSQVHLDPASTPLTKRGLPQVPPMVFLGGHQWSSLGNINGSPWAPPILFLGNEQWSSFSSTDGLPGVTPMVSLRDHHGFSFSTTNGFRGNHQWSSLGMTNGFVGQICYNFLEISGISYENLLIASSTGFNSGSHMTKACIHTDPKIPKSRIALASGLSPDRCVLR